MKPLLNLFGFYNGTRWLKVGSGAVSNMISDADSNTAVQTEKNINEDMIRFSLAGNERWTMKGYGLEPKNASASVYIGKGSGLGDNINAAKYNVAIGDSALQKISSGAYNTAVGTESMYSNTSGLFNTAHGRQSLYKNIDGIDNTAIGNQAMFNNSSGAANVAVGDWCLLNNTIGNFNNAIGQKALYTNKEGSSNTSSGLSSLYFNSSGSFNTASGFQAGLTNATGSKNTFIGSYADVTGPDFSNAGPIGYKAKVSQSNSFVIGGTGEDAVNVGIGISAPSEKLDVAGNIRATGTITPSDMRFKKNIVPLQNSLQKILLLNGVSYNWRTEKYINQGFDNRQQIGFIAQEVENIFPQVVQTTGDGYKGVDYSKLIPVLVEAIKEQYKENILLKERVENLEKSMNGR